ncbi:hypothetical protein BKA66DRAFT_253025 [Pyrenochaeta sp. MPI-SDFR-AT-0127]|nr:hypothetical protein BKA66DRAFT_253025 [Pyrenochaeta sp. MPI-SDFR-AT-0127]
MGGLASSIFIARIMLLPLSVLFLLSFIPHLVSATCFFPNGDIADSGHKECNPNTNGATTCCAENFECLSNGLCNDYRYENWTRVLRGACTSQEFGEGCNNVCASIWPQGDEAVWYCGGGQYCCSVANDCCANSNIAKHNLGEPSVVATAGKTGPTGTTSRTSTSIASATPTQSIAPSSGSSSNTRTIAIAVGVVAGLLLVLLVGAIWYIRKKRKAKREQHTMHELSGTPQAAYENEGQPRNYEFDDKRGGWVSDAAGQRMRKSRNEIGGGVLHEAPGNRGVEMSAQPDPKEVDGWNGPRASERGVHMNEGQGRSSPMESRRSRFVEGDVQGKI